MRLDCEAAQSRTRSPRACKAVLAPDVARAPKAAASRLISALARISHRLTAETRERPSITSLRLLALLTVPSSTPPTVKRRGPRTDGPLTHFASPKKWGLVSLLAILAPSALLLTSCGYRVVGTADTIPDTVQTIAITTFQNATTEYKIEQHLTASIVREFIARTRFQVVSDQENADATLSGTVLNFLLFPTIFDPQSGRATSIAMLTQVHVTLRERKTGAVIYENPLMEFRERYEVSTVPEAYFEEREAALIRTSQSLARSLVSAVLSGF